MTKSELAYDFVMERQKRALEFWLSPCQAAPLDGMLHALTPRSFEQCHTAVPYDQYESDVSDYCPSANTDALAALVTLRLDVRGPGDTNESLFARRALELLCPLSQLRTLRGGRYYAGINSQRFAAVQ